MKPVILALFLMSGVAVAQEKGQAGEEKVSFTKITYPFEGEVTADRLFVRRMPTAEDHRVIATTVKRGAKVTVVGLTDQFYEILPVTGCVGYIFAKNVKVVDKTGTVMSSNIPIRMDSRMNAEKLCLVKEGTTLKVLSHHMGWLRVQLPPTVKYYVGKKYIKFMKVLDPALIPGMAKKAPLEKSGDAKALLKMNEADGLVKLINQKIEAGKLNEIDFAPIVTLFEEALVLGTSEEIKADAEAGLKNFQNLQTVWSTYRAQKMDLELKSEKLRQQLADQNREPAKKTFAFTGYVGTTSFSMVNRPGRFRLIMSDKTICFLKAKDARMLQTIGNNYKTYVGVNGTIVKDPKGWEGYSLVIVDEILPIVTRK